VLAFKSENIDFVRSFLWPPVDSIVKTKSFDMTWSAGGPWLDLNGLWDRIKVKRRQLKHELKGKVVI
jgi:hypothetical protein